MKIYEAITVLLVDRVDNLTQTKWNKLLFFIDGAGICNVDKFTSFEYIKLPYGPVPDNYSDLIYEMNVNEIITISKSFGAKIELTKSSKHIDNLKEAKKVIKDEKGLKSIMAKIIKVFQGWSAIKLSDFSHELDAWKDPQMYSTIDLGALKEDSFLKREFGEANFGLLL